MPQRPLQPTASAALHIRCLRVVDTHISTLAAGPWNQASLEHLRAVTLAEVQCHADTLAAALPRVPLDRLVLDCCSGLFKSQDADDRALDLKDRWVQGLHMHDCCLIGVAGSAGLVAAWQVRLPAQAVSHKLQDIAGIG